MGPRRHFWITLISIVILAVVAVIYLFSLRNKVASPRVSTSSADLEKAAQDATAAPVIDVPSANPADKLVPQATPVEKTNPFKNVYQNPFE